MMNDQHLSRRERQIMDVLHARSEATAAEVLESLPDAPGYSAVRALLRLMEEKGHIAHRQDGARYVFRPQVSRQAASRSALKRVVATFFQGSVTQAMAALLETADTELPKGDVRRLRQIVERARKEGR
jgi:BlaI family transcriptional regulator, penicillinase repressor